LEPTAQDSEDRQFARACGDWLELMSACLDGKYEDQSELLRASGARREYRSELK